MLPLDRESSPGATASDAPPREAQPAGREAPAKKERVLHTRVPAVLEQELKRFADNLRIPVSNLVRTILEDAVNVADAASDRVEEGLKSAVHQLAREREKLKNLVRIDPLADVFAFQPVTLAQPSKCAKCGGALARGARAHLGLVDGSARVPRSRVFVCDDCLPGADGA